MWANKRLKMLFVSRCDSESQSIIYIYIYIHVCDSESQSDSCHDQRHVPPVKPRTKNQNRSRSRLQGGVNAIMNHVRLLRVPLEEKCYPLPGIRAAVILVPWPVSQDLESNNVPESLLKVLHRPCSNVCPQGLGEASETVILSHFLTHPGTTNQNGMN